VTRVRDDAKTRKAAASRLRRNWRGLSAPIFPTEFVERAEPGSSASFESQLLLPAMFQVSVSWVEIPFVSGGIRISNASKVPKRFTRGKIKSTQLPLVRHSLKAREFFANS
jgi:hypothetical protein